MARDPRRPPKKRGGQTKYSPEIVKKILQQVELGHRIAGACRACDISPPTFANWQVDHPELAEMVECARAKFVSAHLANIKSHARDQWTASAWLLERIQAEEFSRPEVRVQLAQINVSNGKAALNAYWTQEGQERARAMWGDIDDSKMFESAEWEKDQLPAPEQPVAELPASAAPVEPDVPHLSGAAKAAELRKHYAQTPSQPVELEPVPEGRMAAYARGIQAHAADVGAVGQQLRQMSGGSPMPDQQQSPRGLTVAARPTPPPNPNYTGWDDSVGMIDWKD
jgi:hypothetical protein